MIDPISLLQPLRKLHDRIRDTLIDAMERESLERLSQVSRDDEGDTIYKLDSISEETLLQLFEGIAEHDSFVLIGEGLEGGQVVFPRGAPEASARWRIIVDPIDGTRGLMYQKRSAWILTGVALNHGDGTSLQDVIVAVQTEVPLVKQHLSDQLWAVRGAGANAERYNRLTGERTPIPLRPSTSDTIAHGFAMIARFFPGGREQLAAIDEEIVLGVLGPIQPGKAHCFEDQYISTGGQLSELMSGHDRFVADLRPLIQGSRSGLCCHPYDLCSTLIATECGVVITDALGHPLDPPLDVDTDVAWVGYANDRIRRQIEPLLQAALRKRGIR
jgi:fructose-1,6-bisphosphatase/inositol monophosphatase family enzyme